MRLFLLKIVEKQEYALSLLQGEIYANRLAYFRGLEGDQEREDHSEGVILEPPGAHLHLVSTDLRTGTFREVTVSPEDLAAPIMRRMRVIDSLNIFCTYSVDFDNLEQVSSRDDGRRNWRLKPADDFLRFGQHAVAILNPPEFIERVKAAAHRQRFTISAGHVQYYDAETGPLNLDSEAASVFAKPDSYAHQKEHRIAIHTGRIGNDPLRLNIGDIRGIAVYFSISNMDRELSLITQNR